MKINLDDLIGTLAPDPVTLEIGGTSFVVNELSVAQVLKLATITGMRDQRPGEDAKAYSAEAKTHTEETVDFIKSLFKRQIPPQFIELLSSFADGDDVAFGDRQFKSQKVSLIIAALNLAISEVAGPKKLLAAMDTIRDRLATTSSESSPA